MADTITLRISAAAAPYVGPDALRDAKLQAAAGKVQLPPADLLTLVYFLYHDTDPEVKRTALATLNGLEVPFLATVLGDLQLHPRILDVLVQLRHADKDLAPLLAGHPMLSARAAAFLAQKGRETAGAAAAASGDAAEASRTEELSPHCKAEAPEEGEPEEGEPEEGEPEAEAEEDEEFQSKYQLLQTLGVPEKIKMALTGDKEWRSLLIKDANKLVSGSVIKNPRITDAEVLAIAKSAVQNEEIMRTICANKEWVKNYQIRKALAENHKTPLPAALRYVATFTEKDLSALARSKNVSSVIVAQARKLLMSKKNGR